ncbi:hypothetical protein N0V90_005224 [Kalmusia sp. IMI 367209]|nr:hypothetical protein N0V90_005224 [Kalmusia sp. IMI 367209]
MYDSISLKSSSNFSPYPLNRLLNIPAMKTCSIIVLAAISFLAQAVVVVPPEQCAYSYLTQKIDHSDSNYGTFQQRYSIIDEFFKPGGPILMFQGEETDRLDCAPLEQNNTILYEWAKELNGLAVSLEHRYFGPSKPFGNASSENQNRVYLTLDNVMADAVEFIGQLKSNISGSNASKVVVASGSYGGILTGAFRLNHPETFDVAIASAGPVMGFGGAEDIESYNWWNWINRLYFDHSLKASEKIKNAFENLQQKLDAKDDTKSIQSTLNLCTPPQPSNATSTAFLYSLLSQVFTMAAEMNYPSASPGRTPVAHPFDNIIKLALNSTDPLQLLAKANWMWYGPMGAQCLDYEHMSDFLHSYGVPLINYDVFSYITCKYLLADSHKSTVSSID